jgi:predicted PurR-regulated permease PerM
MGEREGARIPADAARMPAWVPRVILLVILSGFAALGAFNLFKELRGLLQQIVIALFLSFALEPAVNWLSNRGLRRGTATAIVLFGLALVMLAMVGLMVPLVISQVRQLIEILPTWLERISVYTQRWFEVELTGEEIFAKLANAEDALSRIAQNVAAIGAFIVGLIFQILTIGLFTFYFVADGPRLRRSICSLLPPARQREVLAAWEVAIDKTGAYFYSRLLLASMSAGFAFIALRFLGIPFALPLALFLGLVSQLIPTVGTYIAAALPLLVALLTDPLKAGILLGYIVVYQQIENYLLSPRITARTMQLHPAVAFFAAIAGGTLAGIAGALMALPFAAVVQATVSTYLTRHEVVDTLLTREGESA